MRTSRPAASSSSKYNTKIGGEAQEVMGSGGERGGPRAGARVRSRAAAAAPPLAPIRAATFGPRSAASTPASAAWRGGRKRLAPTTTRATNTWSVRPGVRLQDALGDSAPAGDFKAVLRS